MNSATHAAGTRPALRRAAQILAVMATATAVGWAAAEWVAGPTSTPTGSAEPARSADATPAPAAMTPAATPVRGAKAATHPGTESAAAGTQPEARSTTPAPRTGQPHARKGMATRIPGPAPRKGASAALAPAP